MLSHPSTLNYPSISNYSLYDSRPSEWIVGEIEKWDPQKSVASAAAGYTGKGNSSPGNPIATAAIAYVAMPVHADNGLSSHLSVLVYDRSRHRRRGSSTGSTATGIGEGYTTFVLRPQRCSSGCHPDMNLWCNTRDSAGQYSCHIRRQRGLYDNFYQDTSYYFIASWLRRMDSNH